jgi:tetratricopeptide (TPR) repeat protein
MTPVISLLLLAQTLDQGITHFQRGEYEAARSALRAQASSPLRDVFLGIAEANTGHCSNAEPRLRARYDAPELRRLAGTALLQCLLITDRIPEAIPLAGALTREFPSDPDLLYQSARLHMRAFNDTVAMMFERTPGSYRVNQLSGEILDIQGRPADAAQEYRKAIAKNPSAVNLHYRLGRALLMEGQQDEARREFEAELRLNPSDAIAEFQIAQIDAVQQKQDSAMIHFERALTLKPDFVEAMVAVAKIRPASAILLLEKAVSIAPANEAARYALMLAYRNGGRMSDAQLQRAELDKLRKPPEGEFTDFLKRLGEKPKP